MKLVKIMGLLVFLSSSLLAQEKVTLSGDITDATNGEGLIGATVYIKELATGAVTNVYGYYAIKLNKGKYTVQYSYIGYEAKSFTLDLQENLKKNVELSTGSKAIEEVVVKAKKADQNIRSTEMGVNSISPKEIKSIPILMGEQDVLKTIQLMPGVKSAGEGSSGFYVRGGSSSQNLILLDEAPVYNASHLMGFFSVFNSDAIKDVKLYKGSSPAQYGGRLSSVLDIQMKEGNTKKFTATGGIGLIASRATVEGPINKGKGSFIVSGRRTYADLFLKLSSDDDLNSTQLYFYDINAKANYRLNEKNRLYISAYAGRDFFNFSEDFGFDWGNQTATIRWNHLLTDNLFSNTSFIYSDYSYKISLESDNGNTDILSQIQDYNLKQDFNLFMGNGSQLKFGGNIISHNFVPGERTTIENDVKTVDEVENIKAYEYALYTNYEHKFLPQFSGNFGLRYSGFAQVGEGTAKTYDAEGNIASSEYYEGGKLMKAYGGLEPRLSLNYTFHNNSSIKASYARNYQYLHLLSNSTSGTPMDLWQPSTTNVKPERSDQVSLGYFRNFKDNAWESSFEVYYKDMQDVVDFKDGASILLNKNIESDLLYGKGWSYGMEFMLKKKTGRLTGWLSYTWSKTEQKFDEINNGNPYPAKYDRTHDISVVGMYQLNKKWSLSANWVYYTGDAVTLPSGKYDFEGNTINMYTERNGNRMPDYHRLDLGATYTPKKKKRFESSWNFSVYNVYNQMNAYSINFRESEANPGTNEAVKLSLFGILPSVTWNFKF